MFAKTIEHINGYELHVFSNGREFKETLVLVHGIGVSHVYFMPFMEIAAKKYNIFALDLPGYGTTNDPKRVLSIDELANVVNGFVQKYGLEKNIIIGHSMGTQIATQAVIESRGLYKKCILMAPTINKYERSLVMQAFRLLQDTFGEPLKLNMIILRDYLRMGIVRYMKTTHLMLSDALEKDIEKVDMPLLVVNGTRDPICPDEWARYIASIAPDGRMEDIKYAPHVFQYSYPEETFSVCDDFIKE